mmetsp:Transcript_5701/g.9307  ORF Transcript_5701/g.9307 Transcript_5701/m.9307 type:complete len:115 (+) Transcript_5701:1842-2186(+)
MGTVPEPEDAAKICSRIEPLGMTMPADGVGRAEGGGRKVLVGMAEWRFSVVVIVVGGRMLSGSDLVSSTLGETFFSPDFKCARESDGDTSRVTVGDPALAKNNTAHTRCKDTSR